MSNEYRQQLEKNNIDYDEFYNLTENMSLDECLRSCYSDSNCKHFAWNKHKYKCYLKSNKSKILTCNENAFVCSAPPGTIKQMILLKNY